MALPKILGIETEYGILAKGNLADNPIAASSLIINSYVARKKKEAIKWDFETETPSNDVRGFVPDGSMAPVVETNLINTVLNNGARFYVDHAHPEYSSPECSYPRQAVLYDRAGEFILREAMEAASNFSNFKEEIIIYKNNSDGKGNSYGCHENYLINRKIPFGSVVRVMVPHLVCRQIFCGSGKIGSEIGNEDVRYQVSQRADFFEEIVGLETTVKRPIINTRDEPHANPELFRRLHVIVGDANMSEFATLLKLGTTALVLSMLEDGYLESIDLMPQAPVKALRAVSQDTELQYKIELSDNSHQSALDIEEQFCEKAKEYVYSGNVEDSLGPAAHAIEIVSLWEKVLTGLRKDPLSLGNIIDWIAKFNLLEAYRDKNALNWNDPKLKLIALQYHDLRRGKGLAERVGLDRIYEESDVLNAVDNPPETTRAYFRGACMKRWPDKVVSANWDSIVFDTGEDKLKRVPMLDPLRGTKDRVGNLIDSCNDIRDLLAKLDN